MVLNHSSTKGGDFRALFRCSKTNYQQIRTGRRPQCSCSYDCTGRIVVFLPWPYTISTVRATPYAPTMHPYCRFEGKVRKRKWCHWNCDHWKHVKTGRAACRIKLMQILSLQSLNILSRREAAKLSVEEFIVITQPQKRSLREWCSLTLPSSLLRGNAAAEEVTAINRWSFWKPKLFFYFFIWADTFEWRKLYRDKPDRGREISKWEWIKIQTCAKQGDTCGYTDYSLKAAIVVADHLGTSI